jgi:phage tail sheath gpL-like
MTIVLEQVPAASRVPFVSIEFSAKNAVQGLQKKPYRALIIGPRHPTASGILPVLTPRLITSEGQAQQFFGAGSILSNMVARWFSLNRQTELWAVAVGETDIGASASRLVTISGPSTEAGSVYLYVAGRRLAVPIGAGLTAAQVATAVVNRINSLPTLPCSSSAVTDSGATATFTLTAKGGGSLGSEIPLAWNFGEGEAFPAGVSGAPANYFKLGSGVGEPELAEVWSAIGPSQFDIIVQPWVTPAELTATEQELALRWGPQKQNDGLAISATSVDANAAIALGITRNSPHVSVLSAFRSPHPSYEWASALGAIAAIEGAADPARPLQRIALTGLLAPKQIDLPPIETRNLMLFSGVSTHTVDAFGVPQIERLITTYQKNTAGTPDSAYLDVETVLTLSFLRWSLRNRILGKYPRHKLADDGTRFSAGQLIVTPKILKAECVALFGEWEANGLVEGVGQFKRDIQVERNTSDPTRVDMILPPNLVNQLRIVGAQIGFLL